MQNRHLPKSANVLSACQVRAARAMMNLSIRQLAAVSGLSDSTLRRIETGFGIPDGVSTDVLLRLQAWFEAQGFVFTFDDKPGPGLAWHENPADGTAKEGGANSV